MSYAKTGILNTNSGNLSPQTLLIELTPERFNSVKLRPKDCKHRFIFKLNHAHFQLNFKQKALARSPESIRVKFINLKKGYGRRAKRKLPLEKSANYATTKLLTRKSFYAITKKH